MLLLAVGDILLLALGQDDLPPVPGQDDPIPALGQDGPLLVPGEVILLATGTDLILATGDITTEEILISFSQAQYS
jgi:hypothetical protein